MCDPASLAAGALSIVSSASSVSSQNAAAASNRENAVTAQNDENAQTSLSFAEQSRSLIQGGFDAILEGRAAESEAYTSAIESGVQGTSVKAVLRDRRQKSNRNTSRTKQELKSLSTQTANKFDHIENTANGRISSVSRTRLGVGHVATALSPIIRSQVD